MESAAFKSLMASSSPQKMLWLIRGLPGSGKSTLAMYLSELFHTEHWYEADQYFEGPNGYTFNPAQLPNAHDWCFSKFADALRWDAPCVIVANTFSQLWEMEAYIPYAKAKGYKVQVIECQGDFGSIHNVPTTVINKMRQRWETYNGI